MSQAPTRSRFSELISLLSHFIFIFIFIDIRRIKYYITTLQINARRQQCTVADIQA